MPGWMFPTFDKDRDGSITLKEVESTAAELSFKAKQVLRPLKAPYKRTRSFLRRNEYVGNGLTGLFLLTYGSRYPYTSLFVQSMRGTHWAQIKHSLNELGEMGSECVSAVREECGEDAELVSSGSGQINQKAIDVALSTVDTDRLTSAASGIYSAFMTCLACAMSDNAARLGLGVNTAALLTKHITGSVIDPLYSLWLRSSDGKIDPRTKIMVRYGSRITIAVLSAWAAWKLDKHMAGLANCMLGAELFLGAASRVPSLKRIIAGDEPEQEEEEGDEEENPPPPSSSVVWALALFAFFNQRLAPQKEDSFLTSLLLLLPNTMEGILENLAAQHHSEALKSTFQMKDMKHFLNQMKEKVTPLPLEESHRVSSLIVAILLAFGRKHTKLSCGVEGTSRKFLVFMASFSGLATLGSISKKAVFPVSSLRLFSSSAGGNLEKKVFDLAQRLVRTPPTLPLQMSKEERGDLVKALIKGEVPGRLSVQAGLKLELKKDEAELVAKALLQSATKKSNKQNFLRVLGSLAVREKAGMVGEEEKQEFAASVEGLVFDSSSDLLLALKLVRNIFASESLKAKLVPPEWVDAIVDRMDMEMRRFLSEGGKEGRGGGGGGRGCSFPWLLPSPLASEPAERKVRQKDYGNLDGFLFSRGLREGTLHVWTGRVSPHMDKMHPEDLSHLPGVFFKFQAFSPPLLGDLIAVLSSKSSSFTFTQLSRVWEALESFPHTAVTSPDQPSLLAQYAASLPLEGEGVLPVVRFAASMTEALSESVRSSKRLRDFSEKVVRSLAEGEEELRALDCKTAARLTGALCQLQVLPVSQEAEKAQKLLEICAHILLENRGSLPLSEACLVLKGTSIVSDYLPEPLVQQLVTASVGGKGGKDQNWLVRLLKSAVEAHPSLEFASAVHERMESLKLDVESISGGLCVAWANLLSYIPESHPSSPDSLIFDLTRRFLSISQGEEGVGGGSVSEHVLLWAAVAGRKEPDPSLLGALSVLIKTEALRLHSGHLRTLFGGFPDCKAMNQLVGGLVEKDLLEEYSLATLTTLACLLEEHRGESPELAAVSTQLREKLSGLDPSYPSSDLSKCLKEMWEAGSKAGYIQGSASPSLQHAIRRTRRQIWRQIVKSEAVWTEKIPRAAAEYHFSRIPTFKTRVRAQKQRLWKRKKEAVEA